MNAETRIPIIEGGFGDGQSVLLVKKHCKLHDLRVADINKVLNKNTIVFVIDEDFIDLKRLILEDNTLFSNWGLNKKISI